MSTPQEYQLKNTTNNALIINLFGVGLIGILGLFGAVMYMAMGNTHYTIAYPGGSTQAAVAATTATTAPTVPERIAQEQLADAISTPLKIIFIFAVIVAVVGGIAVARKLRRDAQVETDEDHPVIQAQADAIRETTHRTGPPTLQEFLDESDFRE